MQRDMAKVPEVLIRARAQRAEAASPTSAEEPAPTAAPDAARPTEDEPMDTTEEQYGLL